MTRLTREAPKGNVKYPNGDSQAQKHKHAGFSERLMQSADIAGYNSARLAAVLQISRGTMARYWNGERLIPADLLFVLCDVLRVNPNWLVTGKGDPEPPVSGDPDLSDEENALLDAFRRLPAEQRLLLTQNAQMLAEPHTLHSPRTRFRGAES